MPHHTTPHHANGYSYDSGYLAAVDVAASVGADECVLNAAELDTASLEGRGVLNAGDQCLGISSGDLLLEVGV